MFVKMILPSRELAKLPQGDTNAKLATANLSHIKVNDYEVHKSRSCDRRQYLIIVIITHGVPMRCTKSKQINKQN